MINHLFLQKISILISQRINELISSSSEKDKILYEAARYSLNSSGKRLRPALVMATCEMFDVDLTIGLDPALSIELVHTYSLIHDDLPSMDNDDFRRGKPSLHKAFGEGLAILTGDYLLTFAFELLCQTSMISDQKKVKLIKTLSENAGANGMIGGQVMDLVNEGSEVDEKTLEMMHYKKTASLFSAALQFGAVLGDATKEEFDLLTELGKTLGLAYQIQNDILDITSTNEILGRPIGSDIVNKKATSVLCYGMEKASAIIHQLKKKSILILNRFNRSSNLLQELCIKLLQKKS